MKIIEALQEFKIEATGGYAIFIILCVTFVLVAGLTQLIHLVMSWIH
jgi:hypothetical protein